MGQQGSQWRRGAKSGRSNNPVRLAARATIEQLEGRILLATIYQANMDGDPGWTASGQWAYGDPAGLGGVNYGYPDPNAGYTGTNVYGVNLTGDYIAAAGGPYYVTTPAINCAGNTAVTLDFMRWLNTDYAPYAYATVDVSNNGIAWTNIYTNPSGTEVTDSSWHHMTYSLGAVADNQPTVYVRWGYQIDGNAYAYSGWNIDDVSVTGTGIPPGQIEGDKWNDLDGDGVRDAGEPTMAGWTVYLDSDNDGTLDAGEPTRVTDASGHYVFTDLASGTYRVREVLQSGWTQTCPVNTVQRLFEVRADGTAATIYELDPTTGAAINSFAAPAAIGFSGPQGLAIGSSSLFYIDSSIPGPLTLWELNPDTGAVIDSDIIAPVSPAFAAGLGYLNGKVYIEESDSDQILVWDPVSDTAVTTLNVAADLSDGLTGAGDRGVLYDSSLAGQIFKINPATGAVLATFSPGVGPLYGGLAYVNGELIAADWATSGLVYRINPDTGTVLGTLTLGGTGYISALGGDGAVDGTGAGSDLIVNGGFETGDFSGWVVQNLGLGSFVINNGSYDPASPDGPLAPRGGSYSVLSDQTGLGARTIFQDIAIPVGSTAVTLSWVDRIHNYAIEFADPNQEYRVEIRNTSDSVLATVFSTNPGDPLMREWTARGADLSAFAGQTVRIAFVEQDGRGFFNVHIDDVRVNAETGGNGAHMVVLAAGQVVTGKDFGNKQSAAPTDITLSNSAIAENLPANTVVAALSTTDPNVGDTFTYSLVSGTGSTDNGSFAISGNQLLTAASFNFEAKSSYSIRIRSTDQGGLWYEKVFAITVTDVDEIAPTVTAVYFRGSTWASGYLSFLAANSSGSSSTYGFAVPVGSGAAQLQTLPWRNLNRISIAFSEDVSVAQAQFAIVGSVGSYSVSGFSYNATDHVATWSLSAAMGPDKLYVALPGSGTGAVRDAAGNVLDGEWNNPTSYSQVGATDTFPSGNGTAGGDFAFRFDVLPGDSTGGSLGKVNVADVAQTKSRSTLAVSSSSYRSDFDGNNLINVADVAYVKSKSSIYSLPVNPPVLPVFGAASSQVSLLLSREYSLL